MYKVAQTLGGKSMKRSLRLVGYGLLTALVCWALPLIGQTGAKNGQWRAYGGEEASTRYSPLDQINRDNVKDLRVAWTWKSDNFGPQPEFRSETTPLMVNGVLYFTAGNRRSVVAADAGTGETLWVWRMDEAERYQRAPRRNSGRGVAYWTDGKDERIVTVTPGFHLVALNAKTGIPVPGFGQSGTVDLMKQLDLDYKGDPIGRIGNSSPPVISNDVIVVGPALQPGGRTNKENVKGDVMAFDVRTGRKLWVFHTIPRKGEPGYESWLGGAEITGNAGVWGPFSADPELGYVYLNIEDATNDAYGGSRPGNNLYSSSLVCLDIKTGRKVWHYQLVHHDIWDYDMPPHPILIDLNVDGKRVKAVVQLTKQAFAYVFDRVTGQPVWPIVERPVRQTDVATEWTAPTQPFPTKPPAFDRQGVTVDDLIDFTPALRQQALQAIEGLRIGPIFTPPSLANARDGTKGTIVLPGFGGGANWESGAADPETGFVYVGSHTSPTLVALNPPVPGQPNFVTSDYIMGGGPPLPRIQNLPLIKPPYSRITAYDMNKGEIAWQIANGDAPQEVKENPALKGVTVPRTGSTGARAVLLVTKTLLFAGEGSNGAPIFRAYDKRTGEAIWETTVAVGPVQSLPMTYMHQGRQYIVFASGNPRAQTPAQLVAYALPPAPPPKE
jgi:quinoprotein glucose dehydrogenase